MWFLDHAVIVVFFGWLLSGAYNDYVKYFKVTVHTQDNLMDKYVQLEYKRKYNGSTFN